jgi:hypothetical protein
MKGNWETAQGEIAVKVIVKRSYTRRCGAIGGNKYGFERNQID